LRGRNYLNWRGSWNGKISLSPHEMLRRYGELGFLGINLPEEYGGLGLGHLEALLVLEEFAQISAAVVFPVFEALTGPVRAIAQLGSEELKARIIPEVIRGEKIVAVAMFEPDAGTALTDLTTSARIEGDEIIINGTKRWTPARAIRTITSLIAGSTASAGPRGSARS